LGGVGRFSAGHTVQLQKKAGSNQAARIFHCKRGHAGIRENLKTQTARRF